MRIKGVSTKVKTRVSEPARDILRIAEIGRKVLSDQNNLDLLPSEMRFLVEGFEHEAKSIGAFEAAWSLCVTAYRAGIARGTGKDKVDYE